VVKCVAVGPRTTRLQVWSPGACGPGWPAAAGQKVSGVESVDVSPRTTRLQAWSPVLKNWCSRPGVLEAAALAGWELLTRVLAGVGGPAVGPTRKLVLQTQAWLAGSC